MAACGAKANAEEEVEMKTTPTVVEYEDFDAETDAKVLRKAMKGFGTDEKKIIGVVANRTGAQLVEVKDKYKAAFGRDLMKDLKSELGGKLEDCVLPRMFTLREQDAYFCHKAMAGAGTDELALVDILCTKSNDEIEGIKKAYSAMYDKELEKALTGDVSGDFGRVLISLVQGKRETGGVDAKKAVTEAKELFDAGEAAWGTDESVFNRILCLRSRPQLRAIFKAYKKCSGTDIKESIKSEMSGDLETAMLAIVKSTEDMVGYFAERLYKSMKGLGTDDDSLIRIICTRCEVDLGDIKTYYRKAYTKDLDVHVKKETSGDYEKMLLAMIQDA